MKEYVKIETLYERDEKTKKLIEGKFRNETVEYLASNLWEWTEKIDGTNVGVVWDGHRVSFQGRTEKAQLPVDLVNVLYEKFGGDVNEEMFEQSFGEKNVILFGEGYGKKIQKVGGLYRDDMSFILFDVYLPEKNLWLTRDSVKDIANYFGVDIVPTINYGNLFKAVEYIKSKPMSTIGIAPMEGLVCRPIVELNDRQGKRVIVKIKARDFE